MPLKTTTLNSSVDFFFSFLFVAAQRKGSNEISSTAECPNSAGLPQTETGMNTDKHNVDIHVERCTSQIIWSHSQLGDGVSHTFNVSLINRFVNL